MSRSSLGSDASGFVKYVEEFDEDPDARPGFKGRVAGWTYNVLVISLMAAIMIAWALFLGWCINKFS